MPRLCIAVHDQMLAAALVVAKIERPLSPQETLRVRQERYQDKGSVYPSWYLFGCQEKQVAGLIELYRQSGYDVFLCPASLLELRGIADKIDVQFCALSEELYAALCKKGIQISGFLKECFSSKSIQAESLALAGGSSFLPQQKTFSKTSVPQLPDSKHSVWIVKSPHGSAGQNSSGTPYTVWLYSRLNRELPKILGYLRSGEEMICSEFVFTDDPYADRADHVVHKMPFYSIDGPVQPYGRFCQKFIYHCNRQLLEKVEVLPLGDFVGRPKITVGTIDTIRKFTDFVQALAYHSGSMMLSVDFIIPPDGIPRFLESNKLAGTFAERFDPELPPLIDYYARLPHTAQNA